MTVSPKVFISYSHDSPAHRDFVRSIADQLRTDGIDALIDQYFNGSPREGWIKWMEQQIETADFVLLMCTPVYLQRYRGQDLESGRGVNFEGVVISQILYDAFQRNDKFIPVIPHEGSLDHVPLPLKAYNCYRLPDDYDNLYRHLTNQPTYILPLIGYKKILPSLNNITTGTINKIKHPNLNTLVVDNSDKSSCNHEKNLDTNPNIINLSFTSDYQSKVKPYLEKIFLESNNNLKQINQSLKLLAILALFSTTYWVAEKENIFIEVDITNKNNKT